MTFAATSPADAVQIVYNYVADDPTSVASAPVVELDSITTVYNYEPKPGDIAKPVSLTVFWSGSTATDYEISVRVYSAVDVGASEAQTSIYRAVDQVESILGVEIGPLVWSHTYDSQIDALIAELQTTVGRTF